MTDVDLNFLLSQTAFNSDDDDLIISSNRRTVDDILNDSDSSSSSSSLPSISPSNLLNITDSSFFHDNHSKFSTSGIDLSNQTRFRSLLDEKRGDSSPRSSSFNRIFPPLFEIGRHNIRKPGAALAAATAASRSAFRLKRGGNKSEVKPIEDVVGQTISTHLEVIVLSDVNVENHSSSNSKMEHISAISASTDEVYSSDSDGQESSSTLVEKFKSKSTKEICLKEESTTVIAYSDDHEESSFMKNSEKTTCLKLKSTTDVSTSEIRKSDFIEKNGDCLNEESFTTIPGLEDHGTDDDTTNGVEFSDGPITESGSGSEPFINSLQFAEEFEKKQASTGFHLEKGAVALPMRLDGGRNTSSVVGYFDIDSANVMTHIISSETFRRNYGSPSSLAVHPSFVAVGMSKGVIVIRNICSAHNANDPNTEVTMLGLQGDKTNSPITSIHFNKQGDLLLAGYGDGHVTFWDVQRRSPAKVITGEHSVAVEHTLFFGQDSQNTKQFKSLTADSKGLVLLHSISVSVVPLRNRFSIKTLRFCEESIGLVLSVSPLTCDEFSSDISTPSSGTNGVISTSSLSSLMGGVVRVDSGWNFFGETISLGEEKIILLVMFPTFLAFQLSPTFEVCAKLPKPEGVHSSVVPCTALRCLVYNQTDGDDNITVKGFDSELMLAIIWKKIVQIAKIVKSDVKICNEWILEESAIGVSWLDDQMLVVLTSSYQLYLFSINGYLVYKTCHSLDGNQFHQNLDNISGNFEKTYHNFLIVSGSTIFVLGSLFLVVCRLLSWKERIQVLRKSGDWMGALNMGMMIFYGDAHGIIDLPKSKNALQEVVMNYLVELLLSYVDESISYILVVSENQTGKINKQPDSDVSGSHLEAKEQFSHVGGVVVEFCVHLKKTDILYDEVFTKFLSAGHKDTFLELLEPYILKDMLGSLPPEIMQALVEHYNSKGWLQRVEQCILHMDISSVDFNQVVKLCREHGLYGALIYLFNRGLDDFKAPLEELLHLVRTGGADSESALGYKILVYLKYCFLGLTFPPGHGMLNPSRIPSLRTELILFLLEDTDLKNFETPINSNKNIYYLLRLNMKDTLDVLKCAFLRVEVPAQGAGSVEELGDALVQRTVDTFVGFLTESMTPEDTVGVGIYEWPSEEQRGYLLDFIAHCVSYRRASVSKSIVSKMVEYLTRDVYDDRNENLKQRERQRNLLALLEVIPKDTWEQSVVLQLCEKARFFQVSGFVYSSGKQYASALESYMKEQDEPVHAFIFINRTLSTLHEDECDAFRSEVVSRIPDLIKLNREGAYFMISENFTEENHSSIISKLESYPESLFLYLKTVIELYSSDMPNFSSLKKDDLVIQNDNKRDELESYFQWIENLAKISWNNPVTLTDDIVNLYLELLCRYDQESVLVFLQRFERYQIERCLRICLKYEVADACAFLLERVGDIGRALSFSLSRLNTQFMALDAAVASLLSLGGEFSGFHSGMMSEKNPITQLKEVNNINDTLNTCIGLCQRNTPRMVPDESELLWFSLLNSFCAPMGDADGSEAEIVKWKIPKPVASVADAASVLRKMFSHFLKRVVEGMTGYVPLPLVVSKLVYSNRGHEFGDFRTALSGMLYSYGFERRILETVKLLIEDDMFFTVSTLKKGVSHGYTPHLMQCSICNLILAGPSPASQILVFGCGHVAHVQCDASGARTSTVGCPLCVPKLKSGASKEKRALADDGLVTGSSTGGGVAPHPHDSTEIPENSYRNHQISRFEILSELLKEGRDEKGCIVSTTKQPQLRLSPPPLYHDKVRSNNSNNSFTKFDPRPSKIPTTTTTSRTSALSSSLRLPLKFGKESSSRVHA